MRGHNSPHYMTKIQGESAMTTFNFSIFDDIVDNLSRNDDHMQEIYENWYDRFQRVDVELDDFFEELVTDYVSVEEMAADDWAVNRERAMIEGVLAERYEEAVEEKIESELEDQLEDAILGLADSLQAALSQLRTFGITEETVDTMDGRESSVMLCASDSLTLDNAVFAVAKAESAVNVFRQLKAEKAAELKAEYMDEV